MGIGLGHIDFSKIKHVIYDLDNCLFPYPDGYAREFSFKTAQSALTMARDMSGNVSPDMQGELDQLLLMPIEQVFEMAIKSYDEYGDTTTIFEKKYGIDSIKLYEHHHIGIVNRVVKPTFNRLANPALIHSIEMLNNLGVQQHLFTNGTEYYAREVSSVLGLSGLFKTTVGIDSYNNIGHPSGLALEKGKVLLTPKHMPTAWHNGLELMGIPREDWPKTTFIDDTPRNFPPAYDFGIQTVLLQTPRIAWNDIPDDDKIKIDGVAPTITDFTEAVCASKLSHLVLKPKGPCCG